MLPQVSVEVRLLAEAALAQRAAERALPVVNVADVALEIGRYREGPLAVLAAVWLLARVRSQVASQVG